MFPQDGEVAKVKAAIFDPFEYLMLRHKGGKLNTQFKHSLGTVSYHAPYHQRVQNIGLKTRDVLQLVPDTTVEVIERCSGHDGTYAVTKGVPRLFHEDLPAGGAQSRGISCRPLHQRLPNGSSTDRQRT